MNFCPECECMLYTKTSDGESKKLINYCKNCFWSGDYMTDGDDKISIYKKSYTDDNISHSIYTNPNIIYDNTLPRINNIKCINDTCVSNIKSKRTLTIQLDNTITKEKHIVADKREPSIKLICEQFLKTQSIITKNVIKIAKNICVVQKLSQDNYDTLSSLGQTIFENYTVTISPFTQKKNEIIFIKYNRLELKYMYVCSHCKSSWKN